MTTDGGNTTYESGETKLKTKSPDNPKTPSVTSYQRLLSWDASNNVITQEMWRSETGAAQKNRAAELATKFASMQPVQYVGLALVVAGFCPFGWPLKRLWAAVIFIGGGIGVIAFAHAVASTSGIVLILMGIAVVALGVYWAYDRGALDALLPDQLDKNGRKTQ